MSNIREFKESPMEQGTDERLAYRLTTTPWGSSPSNPVATLYSVANGAYTDVTATNMTGSSSAVGDVITTPLIHSLAAGTEYRLEIQFVVSGNTFEPFGTINCRR
jgi:hypothetical protein